MADHETHRGALASGAGGAWLWCALSAACAAAAFPSIEIWPLVVVWPAGLAIAAIATERFRSVAIAAFASHFALWMWMHWWMIDVSPLGWIGLSIYLAAYPVVFVWLVRRIANSALLRGVPMAVVLPVLWTALEYFRGRVWMDGYPWFLIGHPLINVPVVVQSVDLFGTYFASFLAGLVSGLFVDIWMVRRWLSSGRRAAATSVIVGAVYAANIGYGIWRMSQSLHGPTINVLAIQTNLPQSNKQRWPYEEQKRDLALFEQQTLAAAREAGEVDLIVWPETMVPGPGFEEQAIDFLVANDFVPGTRWLDLVERIQRTTGADFIVGTATRLGLGVEEAGGALRFTWDRAFNSAYLIDGDPPYARYDKLFLTPFGETMPYISSWAWLEEALLSLGAAGMQFDLSAGNRPVRFQVEVDGDVVAVAVPICFEVTMSSVCRRLVWEDGRKAAGLLVNISNDGWFGASDAGRLRHAQIARFRAIENRVPVVRSVNTGLSMAIDAHGNMIRPAETGRKSLMRSSGVVVAEVQLDGRGTLFSRIGDGFAIAMLAGGLGLIVAGWRRESLGEHG